jgi:hypothetical protein
VIDCSGGQPACNDTGQPVADGTACGTAAACTAGVCVACNDCAGNAESGPCQTQYQACVGSSQCVSLLSCVAGCTDQTCVASCRSGRSASTLQKYDAFAQCICGACAQCASSPQCGG